MKNLTLCAVLSDNSNRHIEWCVLGGVLYTEFYSAVDCITCMAIVSGHYLTDSACITVKCICEMMITWIAEHIFVLYSDISFKLFECCEGLGGLRNVNFYKSYFIRTQSCLIVFH